MEDIELFEKKEKCCACSACKNVCPRGAIEMVEDEKGFLYPKIQEDKCIHCGLCKKACAYQKESVGNEPKEVYAAAAKEDDILVAAASGGIFSVLANRILNAGGSVYGVSLEKDGKYLIPKHIRITNSRDLYKLQGSKYIQSDIDFIFCEIKKDLENDQKVLFSGTPCQVDGLCSFLGKKYDNLLTVDIICHGVPNAKMYRDYIDVLEKKYNANITGYKFRDKTRGQGMTSKIEYNKNGKAYIKLLPGKVTSYFGLFLRQEIYRENCYSCKYATKNRFADITIGDYWGVYQEHAAELQHSNMTNSKGISCVLLNTEVGRQAFTEISEDLEYIKSDFEKVAKHNEQLRTPCKYPINRDKLLDVYSNHGYQEVERMFNKTIRLKKCYYWLENVAPKGLKRKIKLIIKK